MPVTPSPMFVVGSRNMQISHSVLDHALYARTLPMTIPYKGRAIDASRIYPSYVYLKRLSIDSPR